MNDTDRRQWIDNDEELYNWWRSSGHPPGRFIKENRKEIDQVIARIINGTLPAHYLKYGRRTI